jgi:hypothetical protein
VPRIDLKGSKTRTADSKPVQDMKVRHAFLCSLGQVEFLKDLLPSQEHYQTSDTLNEIEIFTLLTKTEKDQQ